MWVLILIVIVAAAIACSDSPEKQRVFVKEERSRVPLQDDHSAGGITRLLDN